MEQAVTNYDIMKQNAEKLFLEYDQEEMIRKWKLEADQEFLYLEFLSERYRIVRESGVVQCAGSGREAVESSCEAMGSSCETVGRSCDDVGACKGDCDDGEWKEAGNSEALTIYDLLCYGKEGAVVAGEFVAMQGLSAVKNAASYAGEGFFHREELLFDHQREKLGEACERLGGEPYGKGDVAYRIPVFRDLAIWLQFWDSDEDFPASLQFYGDKNTLDYMHFETIWYLTSAIAGRLAKLF